MLRRASKPGSALRQFACDRRGATAVEFALISIPLMLLMFGILELCLILLVTATLDTATDFAARNIRTGVFQKSGAVTEADFAGLVCRNMSWLQPACTGDGPIDPEHPNTNRLYVEAQTFATFASAAAPQPRDTQDFESNTLCWSVGNPGDIVLVKTYFRWPIFTPLMQPIFENYSGGRLLMSTRLFRNEPFDAALRPVGDDC
ncbi:MULTISPECIES: TadE/TadG family type IV pilus assembly protein [Phenylobacterium]|uniref:Flp pilus assembly protein TadG n=1 Tax=Phenylobacterium koreense TaxID=266125 RepID=A0ABV2EGR8_9CAUL